MPSAHLTRLRSLHAHYVACRDLAIKGDWEGLTRSAEHGLVLFRNWQQAEALPEAERAEAKQLLTDTLAADEVVRSLVSSWMTDVEPLLRTLNKRP